METRVEIHWKDHGTMDRSKDFRTPDAGRNVNDQGRSLGGWVTPGRWTSVWGRTTMEEWIGVTDHSGREPEGTVNGTGGSPGV